MASTHATLLRQPKFWFLSLLTGLYAIYLTLVWRHENISHLAVSLLFGLAVFSLLQDKCQQLELKSGVLANWVGAFLIASVLWYSSTVSADVSILRLLPLLIGIGVGLC